MSIQDYLDGKFVLAGTGSRSFVDLSTEEQNRIISDLKEYFLLGLSKYPNLVIMSGGALGWDTVVARAAYQLEIPYVLCIPNKGYGPYYWGRAGKLDNFNRMLSYAQYVEYTMEDVYNHNGIYLNGEHSNFVRNRRMVELANGFVVYKSTSRGTSHCMTHINTAGLPWKEFK